MAVGAFSAESAEQEAELYSRGLICEACENDLPCFALRLEAAR